MNTSKSPRKISKAQHSINFLTECLCERNRDLMIQEDKNRALLNEIELLKKQMRAYWIRLMRSLRRLSR